VKRSAFIRELTRAGCHLHRRDKRHDIYIDPETGRKSPVSRRAEIKNSLCRLIRKQLGLEP